MRHMYNSDGMIPYAGRVRASRPWKGSRYRQTSGYRSNLDHSGDDKAAEVLVDQMTHKEKIAAILASSKWNHHDYTQG